ncbi:MAG: phosphopantetheine-binding protein [Solirubrobacteraceae bacterium]
MKQIEETTRETVASVVIEALVRFGIEASDISLDAQLKDLDIDSLDVVELSQIVREEFGVELSAEDLKDLSTVGEVVDMVAARAA